MELMQGFEYNASPARVVFGSGTLSKLANEVSRQNLKAPLLLSTPQQVNQAELLKKNLNGNVAGIFSEATMHTPTNITEKALEYAKSINADSVISIGGGSTIGLGKAISIRTGLPHICIPTTYAGSEMTPILGETADGVKKTRSDPKILPGTVIYDVDLTMTLPTGMSATSGVNAIAHAGKPFHLKYKQASTNRIPSGGIVFQQHQPHNNPPRARRHQISLRLPARAHQPLF
jgi:alcohol dehydrogenase class IV